MRIMVRLEWKMIRSSEVSRAMERALGTNEQSVLFGRMEWIKAQCQLTIASRGEKETFDGLQPPLVLPPLLEKRSLAKSFPHVFTFSCVTANKSQVAAQVALHNLF